ncbi:MAG TPA: cystathionine gamma-synthase family protein [Saprospiraceae bacterium]|nr:cystathionine gamma-synthase family protein [Saprospiraceae bacterium]
MNHKFKPESLMMTHGYKPALSEGAIKCPIFQTSTFVFKSAEEGKAFFEVAYGKREKLPNEELGLIYSRLNNPDLEILENRLSLWDEADDCAIFESGMSAISTVLLEFLSPGDLLAFSTPLYGGTDHFIHHFLPKIGIEIMGFIPGEESGELQKRIEEKGLGGKLKMIYIETPANPTNDLIDIEACASIAKHYSTDDNQVFLTVDNTYMGPMWQHPLKHGADILVYSATKYIGGHSDIIAGAVLGNAEVMKRVKTLRTFLGNMAGPYTGWLLMRSLETLKVRTDEQQKNAGYVARYLQSHPKIKHVNYLGFIPEDSEQYKIKQKQCLSNGAMISFHVVGGEKEAFKFLNGLKLIKLAVSLGSTESLAEHPKSMTHCDVDPHDQEILGIDDSLVRLSVGVENYQDIIFDIERALSEI